MTVSETFGSLQHIIADELGNRIDLLTDLSDSGISSVASPSSPVKRAIQSAIAKWEREPFYFTEQYDNGTPLFTTVASQEFYSTADAPAIATAPDLWILHSLIGGNRYTLEKSSWAELEEISPNPNNRGQPGQWAYFAEQIRLYPIPDNAYPIRASRRTRLAPLVNDPDSNAWTTDGFDLIRCEAKLILARDVLHDAQIAGECMAAIYGAGPGDRGYLAALRAETTRRGRSQIKPTKF